MARAVLYIRISELTDATTSPERQRADCTGYAEARGLEVVAEEEDLDVSGTKSVDQRRGLRSALETIEAGGADILICARLDRLARSVVSFHQIVKRVEAVGGTVVSVAEGLDFSTPAGRMVASVLASFAQYESELIGQRVASAKKHLASEGKWGGGRRPYGWRPEPHESGKGFVLRLDPEESEVLRGMVAQVLDGVALSRIAAGLNDAGITTALGKPWAAGHSVRQALNKPSMIGANGAEPLLDSATYVRLRRILDDRPQSTGKRPDLGEVLLPPSLISCHRCKLPMKRGVDDRSRLVYRCSNRPAAGQSGCFMVVSAARVDEMVEEKVRRLSRFIVERPERTEVFDPAEDERAQLVDALDRLEHDRYIGGIYDGDDVRYLKMYQEFRKRLDELPEPYDVSRGEALTIPTGVNGEEFWESLDLDERRSWLSEMFAVVIIKPGKRGRRFDRGRVEIVPAPDPEEGHDWV